MLLSTSDTCVVIFNWGTTKQVTLLTRRRAFYRLVASIIGITMQEKSRPKKRPYLKKPRTRAFKAQGGICYYCNQPMWNRSEQELTSRYPISVEQAKDLRCTGEHLHPYAAGGTANKRNIVAACLFCNRKRHEKSVALSPSKYKKYVKHALSRGAWHGLRLTG